MPWSLDRSGPVALLCNGSFGIAIAPEDELAIVAASYHGMSAVLRSFRDIEMRKRKNAKSLDDTFAGDGRPVSEQISEILQEIGMVGPSIPVDKLSDEALRKLHDAVRDAFDADAAAASGSKPYGVREFSDWRYCSDLLEREMVARSLSFEAIPW